MALHHAAQGEVIDVRPYGAHIDAAQSIALFKSADLEVMRLVLPTGYRMPTHKVVGEITLQCLEGVVEVEVASDSHTLAAGHLMYVARGVTHALTATKAASVLVAVAL